jgi:hypothetical protein
VHTQDTSSTLEVKKGNSNLTIEMPWMQQSLVQNVHMVFCGSNHNNSWISFKIVHLNQNLVDSLFSLIVTSTISGTTLITYSINLANEDDTWGILLGLSKNYMDTGGTTRGEL